MNFSTFPLLMAAVGLALGFGLCWLLMRGPALTPQAGSVGAPPGELAQARDRIRQLEEECQAAVKLYGDLKHQTARARELPDLLFRDPAAPPELTAQLGSLQAQLSALQAKEAASRADVLAGQAQAKEYLRMLEKNQQQAAAQVKTLTLEADRLRGALEQAMRQAAQMPALEARLAALQQPAQSAPVTQLPALEAQVAALQTLEKAIKKEFELLAEVQRNVILTSATRHEFIDSPEARAGTGPAAA